MLQAEESGGREVITAAYELEDLFRSDFEGYVATMKRRLRNLDSQIAAKDALEREPSFRETVAIDAVAGLRALGVVHPKTAWRLGVVATRAWILEIASPPVRATDPKMPTWRGDPMAPADSPFGEWQLWRHIVGLADGVRAKRLLRSFGPPAMTVGDLDEARLRAEIGSEQWVAIRERAAWVLR